ncbi:MAG: serine/threonine-protein kinase [Planctomycetota bacterium]
MPSSGSGTRRRFSARFPAPWSAQTAPGTGTWSGQTHLSTALAEPGRQRLRAMATTMAVAFLFGLGLNRLFAALAWDSLFTTRDLALTVFLTLVGLSALVVWLATLPALVGCRLMYLGMAYQVMVGFALSIAIYYNPVGPIGQGMTPLSVWIVLYPLVVPAPPGRSIVASFTTASMAPLAVLLANRTGGSWPTPEVLVRAFLPNYVCVGLAMFPILITFRMGKRVAEVDRRLREMGSYRLLERLGRGGMGEVWRAKHTLLARPAAVKLVLPEALARVQTEHRTAIMDRFEREARATASLESPHTVQLYDFGSDDDGVLFYVMELLNGIDLEALVERFGPIGPGRCVHLLRQACLSLAEAHAINILHRDIKPGNLFNCRLGLDCDFIKILDFGLARCRSCNTERPRPAPRQLTDDNRILGTPAYMAPELITREAELDGRADIYALGCVGYFLLTGATVFDVGGAMRVLTSQLHDDPPPPSARTEKPLPSDLEAVLMSCLQKDRSRRPSDALTLADRLGACACAGEWTQERARQWWHRHLPECCHNLDTAFLRRPTGASSGSSRRAIVR